MMDRSGYIFDGIMPEDSPEFFRENPVSYTHLIKGLRYEGRTLKLENLRIGDSIHIKREKSNHYNYNNFSEMCIRDSVCSWGHF